MTTKITVEVNTDQSLLQTIQEIQNKKRQEYKDLKEERKLKLEEKAKKEKQTKEEQKKDGAIREEEEEKKLKQPKKRGCGHWLFWDYLYKPWCPGATGGDYAGASNFNGYHLGETDKAQISVCSGNGRKWATHIVNGEEGKPYFCADEVYDIQYVVGYLHYVQYYDGAFGTIYQLPEGATVVPYDPAVYIGGQNGGADCPYDFCWALFFPDELNSGPGVSRKMLPVGYEDRMSGNERGTNSYYLGMPVDDSTSIIVGKTDMFHMSRRGTDLTCPYPYDLVTDPEDPDKQNITYRVFYKYPGGPETGWQPITGYYWLMDPSDSNTIMDSVRLRQVFPLPGVNSISNNYHSETWGFVVSDKEARKLDTIPSSVEELINKRAPDAFVNYYFPSSPRYTYPMWDLGNTGEILPIEEIPVGYPDFPYLPDTAYWGCNPDTQCLGWAKNAFDFYSVDQDNLPYDYYTMGADAINYGAERMPCNYLQGLTPGAYDYIIDGDLNDHYYYNHLGAGSWRDDWSISWDVGPITSRFGELKLIAPEATEQSWFKWLSEFRQSNYPSGEYMLAPKQQIAWMWISNEDRANCLESYMKTLYKGNASMTGSYPSKYEDPVFANDIQKSREFFLSAPEANREFSFLEYKPAGGLKWVSEGDHGSWTLYGQPEFSYYVDPFYDPPYLTDLKEQFSKYKYKIKLSDSRLWPPSVTAGISDPFNPAEDELGLKNKHPLWNGLPQMHLIVNTAWGNNYANVLFELGFQPEDLVP